MKRLRANDIQSNNFIWFKSVLYLDKEQNLLFFKNRFFNKRNNSKVSLYIPFVFNNLKINILIQKDVY